MDHKLLEDFKVFSANQPISGYTIEDVYRDLFEELQIRSYMRLTAGCSSSNDLSQCAFAEVEVLNGKGTVTQYLLP